MVAKSRENVVMGSLATVNSQAGNGTGGGSFWKCHCGCFNEKEAPTSQYTSSLVKSEIGPEAAAFPKLVNAKGPIY